MKRHMLLITESHMKSIVLCGQSSLLVRPCQPPQGEYGEGDPDMEGEGEYEEEA